MSPIEESMRACGGTLEHMDGDNDGDNDGENDVENDVDGDNG